MSGSEDRSPFCSRPGCNTREKRINGYCSVYCEDVHEVEQERDRYRVALEEIASAQCSVTTSDFLQMVREAQNRAQEALDAR